MFCLIFLFCVFPMLRSFLFFCCFWGSVFIFCFLCCCFLFWLGLGFGRFGVVWSRKGPHNNLTLPFLFLFGFCFSVVFGGLLQQTHQTNKTKRTNNQTPCFQEFWGIWRERSGKRKSSKPKRGKSFLVFLLLSSLFLFSFCFSSRFALYNCCFSCLFSFLKC